jgi:hypothetical protein
VGPRLITGAEVGLCALLEVVLGPLMVFLAYDEVPSKWTLIGGSLLLCVLAAHESRPLFEKSREVYRSLSRRLSSKGSTLEATTAVQSSIVMSKMDLQNKEGDSCVPFSDEDETELSTQVEL